MVTRPTFYKHGRKHKPDPPIPNVEDLLPMASMPEADVDEGDTSDDSGSDSSYDSDDEDDPLGLQAHDDAARIGKGKLTAGQITLLLLEHMSTRKSTDVSTRDLWSLVNLLLPEGVDLPAFDKAKKILRSIEHKYVQRIELCANDCIAFWDSRWLPEPYRHEHRSRCPVCGGPRYLRDPVDGVTRSVKVVFFFPLAPFIRSLFARADLVPHLFADADGRPTGDVTRSRGFKMKMLDNPVMNADHRNIGLIGSTDGVPFFEDQKRGMWAFVDRVANLPHGLSTKMGNVHLHMISANEYWAFDADAGLLRRRVRGPKSLSPHMHILADDYLHAYQKGPRSPLFYIVFLVV